MSVIDTVAAAIPGGQWKRPPPVPENWYLLAASHALRPGKVLAASVGETEFVLMRSPLGRLTAFAAHCAHMGCHLRHATVEPLGLRCALHQRLIHADGTFGHPEDGGGRPLTQRTYPLVEHYGAIFVWTGQGAAPDLPLPRLGPGDRYIARPVGIFETRTDWVSLLSNAFDMEHLATVHRRRLIEAAEITRPTVDSFRLSYRSRVIGTRISDRVVKRLSGNQIHASMTSWRGSMMFVESTLGQRRSFFILSMCPRTDGGTEVRSLVGAVLSRPGWLDALRLRLTATMFISFLSDDFQVLDGLRWHPPAAAGSAADRNLQQLALFLSGLRGQA
ncbi:MAG: Rieske 2Fe-2S domain-containing protein [Tabrizicola sp.]|nr:Rieske 2Fe-2S domain-containing protein [Tabrizicola sp.]